MSVEDPEQAHRSSEYALQSKLCFGNDSLPGDTIQEWEISERLEGSQIVKTASAVVVPPPEARWDYQSKAVLRGPERLEHHGVCAKAVRRVDGAMEFSLEGSLREFERSSVKAIDIFGMLDLEIAYWFPLLTGLVRGVEIPGLTLNRELRPFLYAVPLSGLIAEGETKSFFVKDFGVASGEADNVFGPLVAGSKLAKENPVWQPSVPKAWGVVLAHDFIEAEGLALIRAQFTADLISFALRTGISHFETRYDSTLLEWDADVGTSVVSLEPWILLSEYSPAKGWIRAIPLVDRPSKVDLEAGYERIRFFAEQFLGISEAGDVHDQFGKRRLSDRERKMAGGVQRAPRWLAIASSENSLGDQFIALWISLESILNVIHYPGVFQGDRKVVRDTIDQAIAKIQLPKRSNNPLIISDEFIRGRVLQGDWPLRTKLAMFATASGVELRPGDSELIRNLGHVRSAVFHAGANDLAVSNEQLRQLQYLVERLVVAASVHGYEDLEDNCQHQLRFGTLGADGGAAPLFLDNQEVPYTFRLFHNRDGQQTEEFIIEGKVYSERNADLKFGDV